MIHLFKTSDKSWVFSGNTRPANMEGDDYVEGVLPEGEIWDIEYTYTYLDGVATKGSAIEIPEMPDDSYIENRIQAYPSIEEQLDMQYHDSVNGTTTWKDAITNVKSSIPKA